MKPELFDQVETPMRSDLRKTLADILENFAFVEEGQLATGIILLSTTVVFMGF